MDGVVSVNGQSGSSTTAAGGGSGGGIHIECPSLVGYGVVRANGGAGYHGIVFGNNYSESRYTLHHNNNQYPRTCGC